MKKVIVLLVVLVLNFINLYNIGKDAEAERSNFKKKIAVNNSIEVIEDVQNENLEETSEKVEEIVDDKIVESVEKSVEKEPVSVKKEIKEDKAEIKQEIQEKKTENITVKKEITNEQKTDEKQVESNNSNISETIKKEDITEVKEEIKKEESYTEIEVDVAEKKECNGNNHGIGVGNSGKWFNSKDEAISTYRAKIKEWEDKWTDKDNPISDDEYYNNCPCGYEIWTCMYCGKWTLNYYYY